MEILLGFAPFVVFSLVTAVSTSLGVWLALSAAFVITIRDFVASPSLRPLDVANMVIFGALAVITSFVEPNAPQPLLRLFVEVPLAVLALTSLVRKEPLTLAYRPDVPDAQWRTPAVYRANFLITATWTFSALLMALADASVLTGAAITVRGDAVLSLAALSIAIIYTLRHPLQMKAARQRNRRY